MLSSANVPVNLRVLSASKVHELLVPPAGGSFGTVDFVHLSPGNKSVGYSSSDPANTITLVVNPQNLLSLDFSPVGSRVWFWSLETLGNPDSTFALNAPRTNEFYTGEISKVRERFLQGLNENTELVIVPDGSSQAFLKSQGIASVISPPAVNDYLGRTRSKDSLNSGILSTVPTDAVSGEFLKAAENLVTVLNFEDSSVEYQVTTASHVVNLEDAQRAPFPLLAAASLYSGLPLITRALHPRWGYEPGIDYLQVSSPQELHHVLEKIATAPYTTQLMAFRARQKSSIFKASSIFERLLNQTRRG